LSLRANFSWSFVANGLYLASQWATLTAIAKLGRPEMVGQFALALAITAPVLMFCNLNLRVVQATDARRQYDFADYFSLRCMTSALAGAVIVGVVVLAGFRWDTALVVLAVGAAKIVESLSDVFHGLYQQRERMDSAGRSIIAKGLCAVIAIALGVYLTHSVFWAVVVLACVWGILFVCYDCRIGVRILRAGDHGRVALVRWAPRTWRRLALLTLPAGVVALLDSVLYLIPRYTIASALGEAPLGIFAAMAYVAVAGHSAISALTSSTNANLAKRYADGNRREFCSLTLRIVGVGAVGGGAAVALAVLAGPAILATLYTAEYAVHADVFVWLMVAASLTYVHHLLWSSVTAARQLALQVPLFVIAALIVVVTSAILIPRFGLMGAAAAMCISGGVQLSGMTALFGWAVWKCPRHVVAYTNAELTPVSR
jgi:O-antigen/teichoic acid export membrane protein